MKLLMIYASSFGYSTSVKNLDTEPDYSEKKELENVLIGFIQAEKKDEENISGIETKLVKNLKWAAKKNTTNRIVLHSFAHLSPSKADQAVTRNMLNRAFKRLEKAGYECFQTPFGYFLDLDVKAPGKSLARIFKDF